MYEQYIPPQIPTRQSYIAEEEIKNIVGQIDPKNILDNLCHALKGEIFNKQIGKWEVAGEPLANEACRGWINSNFSPILSNSSTMGILSEQQFSNFMIGTIKSVLREFRCNLEKYGFVEPGPGYKEGRYENKGTPDTSRMNSIAEMIFQKTFIVYSRSVGGSENKRVFKSLTMNDSGGYGGHEEKKSWVNRILGR
ncbi:MAG: hypothetical protein EHM47_00895 [Ignavibacteriales bacterium]|nr:MAG: hypothetical protein EHM47_00895 [Ignavibacteriales bacterium]